MYPTSTPFRAVYNLSLSVTHTHIRGVRRRRPSRN